MARRGLRFAVIGAGMAGILAAIRLREVGFDDVTVYEKADQIGGTWRENTYPGIRCDVPSHLYSYSFALNPEWSQTYSEGAEIQGYLERVAAEHGVLPLIRFGDEVVTCTWEDDRWHLETAAGHEDRVDVVIAATGVLHHPRDPEIEGIEDFAGPWFHSARWDHAVTLEGARVGVVGTGSSATQIVAALAGTVAELVLFQRTAQWIMPSVNPPIPEEERAMLRADPASLEGRHAELGASFDVFSTMVVDAESEGMRRIEEACRANLEDSVADPELRARLRPDYRAACKRLVVSAGFYEGVQHPSTRLVTTPIERVEPEGVRTVDGALHELDVLALAIGFKVDAFLRPMRVTGRDGVQLDQAWEKRPSAYLSIAIPDFPNLFMLNGPNGPVGNFSLIEVAELQMAYILQLVDQLAGGRRAVSPTQEALGAFEQARLEASASTIWASGCRSWYLDDRGVPMVWPWPFSRFRQEMASPDLAAYDLR